MKTMNTKFILKGFWDNEPAYYVKLLNEKINGNTVIHLSTSVDEAQKFDAPEEAEKMFELLPNTSFKIFPVCPLCGKDYDGHPAISRKDNKSEICSNCGVGEAFMDFIDNHKDMVDLGESVITFIETQKKATNL